MRFEDALEWYRQDRFTAADVTRATGLSERSQRELQKLGLIQPVRQLNPKAQRLLSAPMVKRSAIIATLAAAGLSLNVAGRMVCAAYQLEGLVFAIVDPVDAYFDKTSLDKKTGNYLRLRARPHVRDTWFDPSQVPGSGPADYTIALANSHFAMIGIGDNLAPYGELTSNLTEFVWWRDAVFGFIRNLAHENKVPLSVYGYNDFIFEYSKKSNNPQMIYINVKDATEEDEQAAEAARKSPVSFLHVNASLALRIALRRLLYIDPPAEKC